MFIQEKDGFTFQLGNKDVFIETKAKYKTNGLAKTILKVLGLPENPDTIKELLYWMQKAKLNVKCTKNGRKYYEIYGKNFGGRGNFIDEEKTIVISI